MNKPTSARTSLLPVWLWFWLGVYIVTLPTLISYLIYLIQDSLAQYYTWSVEVMGENTFFELLRGINLYEIVAYIVILVGVISIFFPQIRGRITERKYRLAAKDENPAIQEITAFIQQYVPHIQVRANLLRSDLFAITYPLGFRKPAIGVFGGLVKVWRADRKTAEAILLHEIGHIRQGDTLVLGAGSLFEKAISYWVWIYLLLVFIPILLYTGRAVWDAGSSLTLVIQLLINGVLSWIGELLTTFALFVLPLAGIWSSELMADRLAAEEIKSSETMQKAMALLTVKKSWIQKIFGGVTHPPTPLRRFLVEHAQSGWVILLLTIFFPLMYPVRLLVNLGSLIPLVQSGLDRFAHNISLAINTWAGSVWPTFIAMVVWLLLWKWLEPWWGKLFVGSERKPGRSSFGILALSAVVPLVAAMCAGLLALIPVYQGADATDQPITAQAQVSPNDIPSTPSIPTIIPTKPGSQYKIGQVFQVGDAQVVVLGWETLTNAPDQKDTADKMIIQVEVAVRNNGADNIAPLVSCARLKDASGKEYHYSLDDADNSIVITHDLPSGAPKPGEKIQGKISFSVDRNSDGFQFIYIANPPLDMTRASVALTNDALGRISPSETLPGSNPSNAAANQALALKDITVMVTRVWTVESKFITPDPDKKLIALDLTIKNTGSETYKIANIFMFEFADENGITYFPGAIATAATGKKLPDEDLAPGKEVSLSIGFELPKTLKKARFQNMLDDRKTIELDVP